MTHCLTCSKSVVARLQAQADEPDGKVARQAMVLLHKTLRSLAGPGGRREPTARRGGTMKLVSVRVEHFRCIRNAKIEFGGGLNVLHGPNDLGKSSLAHAIRAALVAAKHGEGARGIRQLARLRTSHSSNWSSKANRSGSGGCGKRSAARIRLSSGPAMGSTLRLSARTDVRWTRSSVRSCDGAWLRRAEGASSKGCR